MRCSVVSSAGKGRINEDLAVVIEGDACVDLILMDGATPLTGRRWTRAGASDPAWFVRRFARDLAALLDPGADQDAVVAAAVARTRAAYFEAAGGATVPPYALPIATLSWVRVHAPDAAGTRALELYCLGDSKVLLGAPDGTAVDLDPFDNPQERVTQDAVATLVAEGIADPAARWERLLPMLRARRAEQNAAARPVVLCLDAQGPFAARRTRAQAPAGSTLLALTDGLYRLVDTYGLHTDASLLAACATVGLDALVDELRRFEAGGAADGMAAKGADDASAIAWRSA